MGTDVAEKVVKKEEKDEINKTIKKSFTIMGLSVWRILVYFIIYSFAGFIIETLFGLK